MKHLLAPSLLALALALPASAIPVVNGDFETGDFTGWTQIGNTGFSGASNTPFNHTGTFGAAFGPIGSLGGITQNLATVAGAQYAVSFWLQNLGGTPNAFQVSFDGTPLQVINDGGTIGYTQFSFIGLASTASTALTFEFRHDPNFWALDDIAVEQVPELNASSAVTPFVFMAMGLLMAGSRRKGAVTVA